MTMLAHSLKNILELVPEALPLVKKASVEQEFPLDNKDSCIASALQVKYFQSIDYHPVDLYDMEKIAYAVDLYGVKSTVDELASKMIKSAEAKSLEKIEGSDEAFLVKQASFENATFGLQNILEKTIEATALYKEAKERGLQPSEEVVRYSCNGYLNKEAAIKGLSLRFTFTKNQDFVKIAKALVNTPDTNLNPELMVQLVTTIDGMDKSAGLQYKGFDFFKEAFFIKEAAMVSAMNVKLDGCYVPFEKIQALGKARIGQHLGTDIAAEMDNGPQEFKQVLETLPLDVQKQLCSLLKNV